MDRTNHGDGVIEADIRYLADANTKPVFHARPGGDGETTYDGDYAPRRVRIADGRPVADSFDLDRHGFALVKHATAVGDFYDDDAIASIYEAEVIDLVKRVTGARDVSIFDHTRRASTEAVRSERKVRDPASIVHNDYTDRSAAQRLRDHLGDAAAEPLLARRYAIINVWRSIAGPVESMPLALCDAASVAPEHLIAAERRAKDRIGEIQYVVYDPAHRWTYFPKMAAGEAILIKTYDSETDGRARFTIHTAFDDPTTPADAPPRESMETRTFAFF